MSAIADGLIVDSDNSDDCTTDGTGIQNFTGGQLLAFGVLQNSTSDDCERQWLEFDTSFAATGISDDDVIHNVTLFTVIAFFGFGERNCDINQMDLQPSATLSTDQGVLDIYADIRNGTTYIDDDAWCADDHSPPNTVLNKTLGAAAAADMTALLDEDWYALGFTDGTEILDTSIHLYLWRGFESFAPPTLQVFYNTTHHFESMTDELGMEDSLPRPIITTSLNFTALAGDTFGSNPPHSRTAPYAVWDDGSNELCDDTEQPFGSQTISMGWFVNASASDCLLALILWDIELIPDSAIITQVDVILKGASIADADGIALTDPDNSCQFRHIENYPTHTGDAPHGADASDGEIYLDDPLCSEKLGLLQQFGHVLTPEPPVLFPLGNATGELQDRLGKPEHDFGDWFALGLDFDDSSRNGTLDERQSIVGDGTGYGAGHAPILQVRFSSPPDQILDLTAVGHIVDVDLDWTAPRVYGYTNITGYQINFTTPQGNPPLTIIINDTGSTTTDALITGLTAGANYTFRIGTWDDSGLMPDLSNEANATTRILGNFTIGTIGDTPLFTLNDTQADARDIKYIRTDVTDTQTVIEVIHPNSFNLQCDMYFKLALSNQSHSGLTTVPEGTTEQKATFTFNNQQRDIIEITCFDTITNVSADYLVTQSVESSFLLLEQFKNFRDGTYGTAGQFGSIDLITLGAVIVAMIGFNRVNETVGAIFAVVILGMLTFFEIVVWQTFMFGTMAAVLMLVIASTRKR